MTKSLVIKETVAKVENSLSFLANKSNDQRSR